MLNLVQSYRRTPRTIRREWGYRWGYFPPHYTKKVYNVKEM